MDKVRIPPDKSSLDVFENLSYPKSEALSALRDASEGRPPAWISCPVEALDKIRERHDGERYGYLTVATYVAVGFYTPYGGDELAATVADIAAAAGCSERSARRRLRILEELDLLERAGRKTGRGRPNRWRRPVDPDARAARVPYWVPALVSLCDDLDGAALALYTGIREHVDYGDGETVSVAAGTLADAALIGRRSFDRSIFDLLSAGAVERDDGRETWGNVVYVAPRTPPENGILYLIGALGLTDKGGHSGAKGGHSGAGGAVSQAHILDRRDLDRNEDTYVSSTETFPEGGAAADGEKTNSGRGQRTETDDLNSPADSSGADGAEKKKKENSDSSSPAEAVQGRKTEGRSAAADGQEVRRRIVQYCKDRGIQIPAAETLDRVAPAVVAAAEPLDDEPADLLPDLLKLLVGGKGRRRTPYWPDFLDVADAADGAILRHLYAHARAWQQEGPGLSLADASIKLQTAAEAMLGIPAEKAEKWAGLAPEMRGLEAPARLYHPDTVERAGGGNAIGGGDLKGVFNYGRWEIGAVEGVEVHDDVPDGMVRLNGQTVPVD